MGARTPKAFTLIELLVVIALIAILIGILLPSLGKARATGQQLKCILNVKQMAMAAVGYAGDYKERIWPVANRKWWPNGPQEWPPETDPPPDAPPPTNVAMWAQLIENGTRAPGLMYKYIENLHQVAECPTNKRRRVDGQEWLNMWSSRTGVAFDYTMLDEVEGYRLGTQTFVGYLPPNVGPYANVPAGTVSQLTILKSVPLYFEESSFRWNQTFRDGMFGNTDQLTSRHFKSGNVSYADGSAGALKAPTDGEELVPAGQKDFEGNDLYASGKSGLNTWWKISDRAQGYGWINSPK